MIKKILIAMLILSSTHANALANTCTDNSVKAFDLLNSWSKSMNKRVVVDLPISYNYCVEFEKDITPKNNKQLENSINSLNVLFAEIGLLPINVHVYSDTLEFKKTED